MKDDVLTEKAIQSLNYVVCKLDIEGQSQFNKWYNIAYSIIYTKLSMGADFEELKKFCEEDDMLNMAFLNASKYYTLKMEDNPKPDIHTQIASDINLCKYLLDKLQKEVKYYESLLNNRKAS